MSAIEDTPTKLVNSENDFSDNTNKLNKFIFWRVEYNKDSDISRKPFIKPITMQNTWSNYGNQGTLKVYEKK